MTSVFPLEDFSSSSLAAPTGELSNLQSQTAPLGENLEQARLTGYETGYQAGWDDCVKTEADDQGRIGAEFARNLQDLSFTFHEARSHVIQSLEPLLSGILEKVLPTLVSETIGQTILEELLPLAANAADAPIEVVLPPSARTVIEPILNTVSAIPFTIFEEPSLAEGQVFLRAGQLEKHLDLTGSIQRISVAINDLYTLNEKAFQNG